MTRVFLRWADRFSLFGNLKSRSRFEAAGCTVRERRHPAQSADSKDILYPPAPGIGSSGPLMKAVSQKAPIFTL